MAVKGSIPKTMKALVAYSKDDYRLELEYPTPECGPDDIIIKTEACGVCAGDLKCKHGAAMFWGDDVQPSWVKPPFIPATSSLAASSRWARTSPAMSWVTASPPTRSSPAASAASRKDGHYWMCQPHDMLGYQYYNNGGMAEYVRYPKTCVISRVPDEMSLEQAALIEPYGCSKHAVDRANISNEDVVVISGAGTLGLGMITYARMKNPKLLIVLDMQQNRLDKAKEFGADLVFNPGECDIDKEIKALTDGYGCDIYIEATGNPASVIQGLTIIRKLGTFVEFSVFGKETTADWSIIGDRKELDVLGAHLSPYCFPFVIENIANGNLKTEGVVSRLFSLEDWQEAFEYAAGKHGDFKVAFQF